METPIEERLVKIQRDISEQWDAEKKKIGADLTERYTRAEVDERLGQLKSSLDEDLKRKVEELVKASHEVANIYAGSKEYGNATPTEDNPGSRGQDFSRREWMLAKLDQGAVAVR